MAKVQNFSSYLGEDSTVEITLDPVVDVTGWTTVLTVKPKKGGADPARLTIAGTVIDGPTAVFHVPISAAHSIDLGPGVWAFDFCRTDPGAATELTIGQWTIKPSVRVPTA